MMYDGFWGRVFMVMGWGAVGVRLTTGSEDVGCRMWDVG